MSLYRYSACVVRWVDGDTVDLLVELGFHVRTIQRFRLIGVNTPERGQPGYAEARACAESVLPPGSRLEITSQKSDKYGRWLVELPEVTLALRKAGLVDGG